MSAARLLRSIPSTTTTTPRFITTTPRITTPRLTPATLRPFHSTSPNMVVHAIKTNEDFETMINSHKSVIVDCFAVWCGPCKMIAPVLEKLSDSDEFKDSVHFTQFDVDDLPELTEKLEVRGMPTFLFYKDGKKVDTLVGAHPQKLVEAITAIAA